MSDLVERLNRRHVMSMYAKQSDLYAAMEADREEAAKRIAELEAALAFYADPTRYHGPNQSLDYPDSWSEQVGLQAYRLDVTRDQGVIARNALKD